MEDGKTMQINDLLIVPEDKKGLARILIGIIVLFLFLIFIRACSHPGKISNKEYLKKLSDSKADVQIDGLIGLGKAGYKPAVPEIEKILSATSDEKVRKAAIYSIFILDKGKFLNLLKSSQEQIRIVSLKILTDQDKEKACLYLEQGLSDPSLSVRQTALSLLSQYPNEKTIRAVLRIAENGDEDASLRTEALLFLGKNADSDILPQLKNILFSLFGGNSAIREAAANAISEIETREKTKSSL